MGDVFIREIRNNAGVAVSVRNLENPDETAGGNGHFLPGESKPVRIKVPKCEASSAFASKHIEIRLEPGAAFDVWQASFDWKERVRVSSGGWLQDGPVIGGVAATGPVEDMAFSNERMLVINDLTLWLAPYLVAGTVANMAAKTLRERVRLHGPPAERAVPGVPRKSAISFSMPGISSDAFDRRQPGARFLSRDSGQRREFTVDAHGAVQFRPPIVTPTGSIGRIDTAISHVTTRAGHVYHAPPFEIVAANGGRVFAKERGADRFYFAMVDLPYIHVLANGTERDVPSTYFKLDPEFNQETSNPRDLLPALEEDFILTRAFGGHPAAERYPLFRLLLGYGVIDAMVVRNRRCTWHLIDARTPGIDIKGNLAASFPEELGPLVAGMLQTAAGTAPPSWVPALDDVYYRWSGEVGAPPGGLTSGPDAALNASGGLVVFGRGADGALWHAWQARPDGNWVGWASLGGAATSDPAAVLQTGGRLAVFVRGTDNAVWHRWQLTSNGEWSGWASIGGPPGGATGAPAAALNAAGGLVVFARGGDGALWHAWQAQPNGNWSGWASLGGTATSDPGAVLQTGGRLAAFVRGTDNTIWHQWQLTSNGAWSGWASIGAPPGGASGGPDAALNASGGLVVIVRGGDGALWHTWQSQPNGTWSAWTTLGGDAASDPCVVLQTGGRLALFVKGAENIIRHRWQLTSNGQWSGWTADRVIQKTIHYDRVLDIGVGHVPHHEQNESVTGGELMPLRVPAALSDYWTDAAQPYRFMNGPVRDADGFIDGTGTYFLLAQLKADAAIAAGGSHLPARNDAYGLLYMDEQAFFTQRWRLAHPDDWRGPTGGMTDRVHDDAPRHQWDPSLFWCPFRSGHIGPRSRLAVAAQVALVTGEHPVTGQALLYSVTYAHSAMDRTWRWRALPAPARYFDGQSLWNPVVSTLTGDEPVPAGPDPCVYPQTLRVRDDLTICLRGRGPGPDGSMVVGYWYQRYLPAANELVPPADDPHDGDPPACAAVRTDVRRLESIGAQLERQRALIDKRDTDALEENRLLREENARQLDEAKRSLETNGCNIPRRPRQGYAHPWKFLPDAVFQLADRFSHFGVYDVVDSRMQYYPVTPASPADAAALTRGERGAWVNDPARVDDAKTIKIDGYTFRFDWARLPWPTLGDPGWGPLETMQRIAGGLMALFIGRLCPPFLALLSAADADEIPSFPPLPQVKDAPPSLFNKDTRLRIVQRGSQWIAMHWDKRDDDLMPFVRPTSVALESRKGPELKDAGDGGVVQVALGENQWVAAPPAARVAYFNWAPPGPSGVADAVVGFVTARPQEPFRNVWRLRIAAFVPSGGGTTVSLLDVVTAPTPPAPPPFTARFHDSFYEHRWTPTPAQAAALRQYCTPAGALSYGTSIWIEDVVGHVSVPEEVIWLGTPQPMELVLDRAINVPESASIVDTGIDLQAGDDYSLEASGKIQPHFGMVENGPEGRTVSHEPKFPLCYGDDAHEYSLIGRFGSHAWFYVGTGRPRGRFAHTETQRLCLRTNDDAPGGGSGHFSCRVKVWRARALPAVVVAAVVANPPGRDVQPGVGENLTLRNTGGTPVDVGGWYLTDAAEHRMTIASGYVIAPGATLTVFTGPGTNTPSRFYCQRHAAVLNNEGDTVVLHKADGTAVSRFTY